jgi:hypothetical protein
MCGDANQPSRRRLLQACMPALEIPVIEPCGNTLTWRTRTGGATMKAARIALLTSDGRSRALRMGPEWRNCAARLNALRPQLES